MRTTFDYIFDEKLHFSSALKHVHAFQLDANVVYNAFFRAVTGQMSVTGELPIISPMSDTGEIPLTGQHSSKAGRTEITDSHPIPNEFADPRNIPLLPIEAYRDARIYAETGHIPELFFQSSGTTTSIRSRHEVAYAEVYRKSIFAGIRMFYPIENMVVLGYTPGYNQNPNSSLIWMINTLIEADTSGLSRFLPVGQPISQDLLTQIERSERSVLLFGAAFGLADLAEQHPVELPEGSIIMETGGMKTYRREMSREQLHNLLADGFAVPYESIHSEYGMTELLSQSYSLGDEWFHCPPWMRVSIRDPFNPLQEVAPGEQGLIGVIDLANWASCPFLLTGDRGLQREDGAFQVLGRWSAFHLRGCNFLLEEEP